MAMEQGEDAYAEDEFFQPEPSDEDTEDEERTVDVRARVLQQGPGQARIEPAGAEPPALAPAAPAPEPEPGPTTSLNELFSALQTVEAQVNEARAMEQSIGATFDTAEEIVNQLSAELRTALRDCMERCQRGLQGCLRSQKAGVEAERALLGRMRAERGGLEEARAQLEGERTDFRKLVDEWEMQKVVTQQANGWKEEKVVLNIGGRRFETSKSTLTRLSDTFFGCLFGGNFQLKREEDGAVFVDRDGTCFEYVLNYLRDGSDAVLPEERHALDRIAREAKFYGLHELEALVRDRVAELASPSPQRHAPPRPAPLPEGYRRGCGVDDGSPPPPRGGPFECALQSLARGPVQPSVPLPGWLQLQGLDGIPPGHASALPSGGRLGLRGPPRSPMGLEKGRPAWM